MLKRIQRLSLAMMLLVVGLNMVHAAEDSPVDFTLPNLEGRMLSLSDYRGKWVLVNYWATWCPPCLEEIPELIDFHEQHKDNDAVVIGVNMEDIKAKDLREFVDEYMISYPVVHMKPAYKTAVGEVPGMPTSFLISPQGIVIGVQSGAITANDLNVFLENYGGKKNETH